MLNDFCDLPRSAEGMRTVWNFDLFIFATCETRTGGREGRRFQGNDPWWLSILVPWSHPLQLERDKWRWLTLINTLDLNAHTHRHLYDWMSSIWNDDPVAVVCITAEKSGGRVQDTRAHPSFQVAFDGKPSVKVRMSSGDGYNRSTHVAKGVHRGRNLSLWPINKKRNEKKRGPDEDFWWRQKMRENIPVSPYEI